MVDRVEELANVALGHPEIFACTRLAVADQRAHGRQVVDVAVLPKGITVRRKRRIQLPTKVLGRETADDLVLQLLERSHETR